MNGEQYKKAIATLGMTQGAAAEFLGVSLKTSNSYANGAAIPEGTAKLLRLMIKLKLKPEGVK